MAACGALEEISLVSSEFSCSEVEMSLPLGGLSKQVKLRFRGLISVLASERRCECANARGCTSECGCECPSQSGCECVSE